MKELQPHQERVVSERNELDEKLSKLRAFLTTDTFASLDEENRTLLTGQEYVMSQYSDILSRRIELF